MISSSTLRLPQSLHVATATATQLPTQTIPRIESQQLFGNSALIYIGHNGEQYRLQRTRANKLILTK